jgi:hypothetical protein
MESPTCAGRDHAPLSYREAQKTMSVKKVNEEIIEVIFSCFVVGDHGVGPCASFLSGKRSTAELVTPLERQLRFLSNSLFYQSVAAIPSQTARCDNLYLILSLLLRSCEPGGADRNRTGAWEFCRLLRYLFATAPDYQIVP